MENLNSVNNPFEPIYARLDQLTNAMLELKNKVEQPDESFIEIEEAANVLCTTVSSVHSMCSRKVIPYYRRGKKSLFLRHELITYIKNNKKRVTIHDVRREKHNQKPN